MFRSLNVRIAGTGSYAPERIVTNEELASTGITTAVWIEENLGIKHRHVAAPEEYTSDLAQKAALAALQDAGIKPDAVDLILVATATPDRKAPSTACLVKNKLSISTLCPALDLAAVCSGFLYGLTIAASLIEAGTYRRIIVIGADTFSKITDWARRDCVFFGDGAGAVVLERTDSSQAFFASELYAECSNPDNFTVLPKDQYFTMNGRAVYETGSRVLPEAMAKLLKDNGLKIEDVSCIIPHQPSIRLLRRTAELLDVPFSVIKTNMERYANTASATVPILLDEVNKRGEIKNNDLVMFAAVGAGWTWGAALYRWH